MTLVQRLLMIVCAALLLVFGVGAYEISLFQGADEESARQSLDQTLSVIATEYRGFLERAREAALLLAPAAPRAVVDANACDTVVSELRSVDSFWLQFDILDAHGIVRCSSLPEDVGTNKSEYPEVAASRGGTPRVRDDYAWGLFSGVPGLAVAAPWHGPDGASGTIAGIVRLDGFVRSLQTALPRGYTAILADRGGHILAALPQTAGETGQPLPSSLGPLALLAEPGHALLRWTDGSERYVAYAPIHPPAGPPVFIAVGARESAITADARALGYRGGLAFLLVTIGSLALTWWGGVRFIRRPLGMLAEVALRWRDGDQSARVSLPGRSEIAALGRVFNAMADAKDHSDQQTRESADLLAALIESSRDCIFVTGPDGHLLLANSTFFEIVGLTRAAAIGSKLVIQHDHATQQALDVLRAQVATTRMLQAGNVNVRAFDDDQPRILQTICTPIFNAIGQIRAVAGIGRDVTDAHQAAEALRLARDRAEAADRAKTRFLAAASHDLRQPLQAAVLLAELLNAQTDPGASPNRSVGNLRRALDDIKCLVDSLFDVSRLDSGTVTPEISSFALQGLLDQTIILYQKVAEDKGISLLAAPTDAIVRSDRVLLGRMLTNLVENAVRYTLSGHVLIECEPIDAHLRIHIEDTGIGISKQDLSRIWDEFEQLKNPARDRRQGLGLGLSIVRRLSTLLDHPVEVSSEPGKGSSFVVTVPVDERHVTPSPQTPANQTSLVADQGHLVVVVDDDPLLLDALHMALEDNGWNVIAATDYAEAIKRLAAGKRPPDMIISDYRLGEGKVGSEVIKGIREIVGRQLPAIILTGELGTIGDNHDQPKEDARRLNATLLRKPVRTSELLAAMRSVMATTAP